MEITAELPNPQRAQAKISEEDNQPQLTEFVSKLRVAKYGAFLFRRRRHADWTDNYTLYRDKVQLNRLTQRQSVNVPLLKSTVKTLLKDIDDAPSLYFTNLDNEDQSELFLNEYWKVQAIKNKLIIKDIVDKRQVLLFGRSFKSLNMLNGMFYWDIVDPQDILVDRYIDPADIDTARFMVHQHIYMPLSSLTTNPKYNTKEVKKMQRYLGSNAGLIKAEENQLDYVEKQKRMMSLGVIDAMVPNLGETYVELNKWFYKEFNPETGKDEITFCLTAENMFELVKCPLEEFIGVTPDNYWRDHFPYTTWGDETERTDFWNDGVADPVRTLNKILNAYFSQDVENRTLRNFGMNYFNSSLTEEGFTPQTFTPEPWGWYPIPAGVNGKLGDQFMNVEVPVLEDNIQNMNFLMDLASRVSAASTTQQGVEREGRKVTLGEVQLVLANAKERVRAMSVYYTDSWLDFGHKFVKMLEATPHLQNDLTIHKKGRLTNKMYTKTISPKDYLTESGYNVDVRSKKDAEDKDIEDLQKLQYPKTLMPNNMALDKVIKQKSLEFAGVTSSEMEEILKEDEEQHKQMADNMSGQMPGMQPGMTLGQPGQPNQLQLPAGGGQPPQPPVMA